MNLEVAPLSIYRLQQMGQIDRLMNDRRMSGPGYCYLLDNQPIAAAGLGRMQGREFIAWCIITPRMRASGLLMRKWTREIKTRYPILRELIKAESVQADTMDEPLFRRWVENLGFERLPIVRYGWTKHD